MRKTCGLTVAALALAVAGSAGDFHWSGTVAAGQAIELKGINGSIDARAASGSEVEVTATKTARRSDPAAVEIKVVPHAGGVTVCAVYPSRAGSEPNDCTPGKGGRMNTSDNDVRVDFTVRVPAGVRLVARTVNGSVGVAGLRSEVEAYTVNGGVELETTAPARAETVNGAIRARIGAGKGSEPLAFATVNGSIEVAMPEGIGAEVQADTVNGGIETDFPLTVKGKIGHRRLSGTIGSGGRELRLSTVNGSIRLRRS